MGDKKRRVSKVSGSPLILACLHARTHAQARAGACIHADIDVDAGARAGCCKAGKEDARTHAPYASTHARTHVRARAHTHTLHHAMLAQGGQQHTGKREEREGSLHVDNRIRTRNRCRE